MGVAVLVAAVACATESGGGGRGSGGNGGAPPAADMTIPGLGAQAAVSFDEQGVLHATCASDADCATVLGYFHAKHRMWQMDLRRRVARGSLATLVPAAGTGNDIFLRRYLSTSTGEPIEDALWASADDDTKAIVTAYAAGVNAFLEDVRQQRNGATLSEEYRIPGVLGDIDSIPPWDVRDTAAVGRLLTWQLSDDSQDELRLGRAFPRLPVDRAVALFTPAQATEVFTMPASGVEYGAAARALAVRAPFSFESIASVQRRLGSAERALALAEQAGRGLQPLLGGPDNARGSNNWVLAPSRTASGRALLANDPHLALTNPAAWYLVDLDSKSTGGGTLHAAGASFPGVPSVIIGRNESIAWGSTTAYYDDTDLYVETLSEDGSAVLYDADGDGTAEEVGIVARDVEFGPPTNRETVTLKWVPHHGPILAEDLANRVAISARWTGHEPTNELRAYLELARAQSVDEAAEALREFKVGAQNFVLADASGRIGWYPHANVPLRPWASYAQSAPSGSLPPWLPLPGDGSAEWEGYMASEDLPQMFDPPSGFVATANQDMTGASADGDPTNDGPYLQAHAAPGYREARIVDLLEEGGSAHTPESALVLQADVHSLPGATLVPPILAAIDRTALSPEAKAVAAALDDWQFGCPTGLATGDPDGPVSTDPTEAKESIGCSAFHYLLSRVFDAAYADEFAAAGSGAAGSAMIRALTFSMVPGRALGFDPDVLWDDLGTEGVIETREVILASAFEDAAAELRRGFGADPNEWRWGRVHTVTLRSEVSDLAAATGTEGIDIGPFANDGGFLTVDAASPASLARGGQFGHASGASLRIVSELAPGGIVTWLQLAGGQHASRDSEHYGDLVDAWLANEPFVLPFTPAEEQAAAVETITVGP